MSTPAKRATIALALVIAGGGLWYVRRVTRPALPRLRGDAGVKAVGSPAAPRSDSTVRNDLGEAGPVKLRPEALGSVHPDVPERTRTMPSDFRFAEHLKPAPQWTGPTPRSLAELPKTPYTQAKLAQFHNLNALNHHLGLLARISDCLGDSVKSRGGVFAEFWFNVNPKTGKATPDRVAMLESSLTEEDDGIVISCLEKAYAASSFTFEPSWIEENRGEAHWVLRSVVSVPVKNDRLYRALLDPDFK